MLSINSNIVSLKSQRLLGESTGRLNGSASRLSSGQRINTAADDAAGLAVSSTLNASSRLFATALRNVSDGISAISIMDSALDAQTGVVQRMVELAEQAANGTYSDAQRAVLDKEYLQLTKELGRIAASSSFNGINLFDDSSPLTLQAGINGLSDALLQIPRTDIGTLSGVYDLDRVINDTNYDMYFDGADLGNLMEGRTLFGLFESAKNHRWDGVSVNPESGLAATTPVGSPLARIECVPTAGIDRGKMVDAYMGVLLAQDSSWPAWEKDNPELWFIVYTRDATGGGYGPNAVFGATLDLDSGRLTSTTFGSPPVDLSGLRFLRSSETGQEMTALEFTGLETVERALHALEVGKNKLDQLSKIRGELGAYQSRLQAAIGVLSSSRENVEAANSRIADVDVAHESANLFRERILQQAGTSVLGQANQAPQIALSLLQSA